MKLSRLIGAYQRTKERRSSVSALASYPLKHTQRQNNYISTELTPRKQGDVPDAQGGDAIASSS